MPLTQDRIDFLKAQKPRAYRAGKQLGFTSPTWAMRRKLSLAHFLPDLEHATRGPIAWRDFANIPSSALKPFFANPSVLDDNAVNDMEDNEPSVVWDPNLKTFHVHERLIPLPARVYSLAADLSVSGDATGISMTHCEPDGIVVLDFSLKIVAAPRVDYRPIEDFFCFLRDEMGFTILGISFDQFQSHRTIQELNDKGFDCQVVRFADTLAGCSTLSDIIHSGHFKYHLTRDKDFIGEAKELQNINNRRVDHLQSGGIYNSKDVWDSTVNSVVRALECDLSGGLRLSEDDIHTIDWKQRLEELNQTDKKDRTVVQFAHIYTRVDEEKDPNVLTLVRLARDLDSGHLVVIEVLRRHVPVNDMARLILQKQKVWAGEPLLSSLNPFACELTATKSKAADVLSDVLLDQGSDLIISQTPDEMSVAGRIEATKELIRDRKVLFIKRWKDDHEMARLVRRILSYPYVTEDYELQALGGAVTNAQEIEFLDTSDKDSSGKRLPSVKSSVLKGW